MSAELSLCGRTALVTGGTKGSGVPGQLLRPRGADYRIDGGTIVAELASIWARSARGEERTNG